MAVLAVAFTFLRTTFTALDCVIKNRGAFTAKLMPLSLSSANMVSLAIDFTHSFKCFCFPL